MATCDGMASGKLEVGSAAALAGPGRVSFVLFSPSFVSCCANAGWLADPRCLGHTAMAPTPDNSHTTTLSALMALPCHSIPTRRHWTTQPQCDGPLVVRDHRDYYCELVEILLVAASALQW
jgi:hypothetical protein